MMPWSRRRTLIAGLLLILATNAVALGGAFYNRSGEPDSLLRLTQRELSLPMRWGFARENSGVDLGLQWRVLGVESRVPRDISYYNWGYGGEPEWLDGRKLAELGVDTSRSVDTPKGQRHYQHLLPIDVLLVLELDGPAYQRALARARTYLAAETELRAANPGKEEFRTRSEAAQKWVKHEEDDLSRLFIVDAGLDLKALRRRYPDRHRYAIVRGQIRTQAVGTERGWRLSGYINAISISRINVPVEIQQTLQPALLEGNNGWRGWPPVPTVKFDVGIAFGRRLEPWITQAGLSQSSK